jgi:hypothetical protein
MCSLSTAVLASWLTVFFDLYTRAHTAWVRGVPSQAAAMYHPHQPLGMLAYSLTLCDIIQPSKVCGCALLMKPCCVPIERHESEAKSGAAHSHVRQARLQIRSDQLGWNAVDEQL